MSDVQTKPLANALASVSKFATGRTSLPHFMKVVLEACEGKLQVRANNACGAISIVTDIPYNEQRAVVEHSALHRAIARANHGSVELEATPSALRIQAGSLELVLPSEDTTIPQPVPTSLSVSVDAKELGKCAAKLVVMEKDVELEVAQGQRLLTSQWGLYLLASSMHGMAGAYTSYEGGDMDVVVLHKSVIALAQAVSGGDKLSLGTDGGWLYAECGSVKASLPTIGGRKPFTRNGFDASVAKAQEWKVCRQELVEFLQQVAVFSTPEATAITMTPGPGGLSVHFDGTNNNGTPSLSASGKCSSFIPGECAGPPVRMSHIYMKHILGNCTDDYRMWRGERAMLVESGNYFAGYAMMGER